MQNWKFSDIPYLRPDYDAAQAQLDRLAEAVRCAADFAAVKTAIWAYEALISGLNVQEAVCFIRAYHDVTDEFYQAELAFVQEHAPLLAAEGFRTALLESPFRPQIDETFGNQLCTRFAANIRVRAQAKDLQAQAQALENQYQQTRAAMRYDLRGEQVSEGRLLQALLGPDRELRKDAYEAGHAAVLACKDQREAMLRQLVHTRNAIARANGFATYPDYANVYFGRLDYGQRELTAFCRAVKTHIVPLYLRLREEQRLRLGLDVLLPYDAVVLFPDGNPKPVTGPALAQAGKNMYHSLSPEAGVFFDEMVRRELLDVDFSDHKISGMGFCADIPGNYRMPFVFANNNGTAADVAVYTHELGHALQGYLAMQAQPLDEYASGGPDFNEIHSKTMELLAEPYYQDFFGEKAEQALFAQHYGIVKELCAFCQIHTFESWLYDHPDEPLEVWAAEYQRIAHEFGRGLHNEAWQEAVLQGADLLDDMCLFFSPLYVVAYALSQICALELKAAYDRDPASGWETYRALCAVGSSKPYAHALADAGLDLPYAPGAVEQAAKTLRQLIWKEN